ncbi:MAG TPA: DUF72 domain-containing protein [Chitinophagaceae bacterium]|jgi:uncharacterized protein YecE (DUF72 family)|nr:DUF72 domain-containing protein [Chitinophagaceae bacterium]
MSKGKFHIGTSGWSYKDWIGTFYPKNLKPVDWLSYYAKTFDCTEINSSFYRLPQKQTVFNWINKVPKEFLFCPKMSRYLTHIKRLKEPEEPLNRFFEIFEPMQKQMGPVLIQLPKLVPFDYDIAEHFYLLLNRKYSSYEFAMEVRHPSWMTEDSYGLMAKYNIAFVISHSGNHFPYAEVITAKNIYFRFHGPGSLYNTKYDDITLKKYSTLFKKWSKESHELWIFFNNDWFGYGIDNALMLRKFLGRLYSRFLLT